MAKTEPLPELKGYTLKDLPNPEYFVNPDGTPAPPPIGSDAKAIVIAILAVATELRLNRISSEESPGWKMAEAGWRQLEAQMTGGIVQGVIVPGRGNH